MERLLPDKTPVVLLVTSNGIGMGHLARQVAVATAGGQPRSGAALFEPVLLSMSAALPVVAAKTGIRAEYCPGPARRWMPTHEWHRYFAARLVALVREVGADAVVFDGISPYAGLLAARRALDGVAFVWFRRGLWQRRASRAPLRTARYFDLVLAPGDLATAADRGATAGRSDARSLGPVSMLETERRLPRAAAAAALGLDPDRPVILISLGAGSLDDPSARTTVAVRAAASSPEWQVAVPQTAIAASRVPADLAGRVTPITNVFPLVRFQAAFDAVVSSAGYNAVHEFVLGGLPTLLVPSAVTATDDQVGRAAYVADQGWALVARADDPDGLDAGVRRLLDDAERDRLRTATSQLPPPTGATEAAALIGRLAGSPGTRGPVRDPYRAWRAAAGLARRGIGEQTWERARRLAGAPPRRLAEGPLPVVETEGELPTGVRRLVVTHDLAELTRHPDAAIEHVLADSSEAYLRDRRAIIARIYES
jgi:UDP:flavonoid glycosyltransferase YjiC (YdhE family)